MVWNRAHKELLNPETVAWEPLSLEAMADGLQIRILSIDEGDGALTGIVRVPPGWNHPTEWALGTRFDLFVLEGELRIGPALFDRFAYTYRVAGFPNESLSSDTGASALLMTYGPLALAPCDATRRADPSTIVHVRLDDVPPRQPLTDKKNIGYFSRTLRLDPNTGERIFVTGSERTGVLDARIEWHPVVEEIYRLGPDESMSHPDDTVIMHQGWYCYRPPRIPHGGFSCAETTQHGSFIRIDTTLVNYYVDFEEARHMWSDYPRERLDRVVADRIDLRAWILR